MSVTRRLLTWLTSKLDPPRIIYDQPGKSKYLSRWYVFGAPVASDGELVFDEYGNPRPGITWNDRKGPVAVYIHRFHRGDADQELHNHPWRWSLSLILAGGYREERRFSMFGRDWVHVRTVLPWTLNFIRGDDYHRVDLIEDDAWSIFFAGPRVQGWNFWNRDTRKTTPWREFIARKRGQPVDELVET
jgi:hypothetical protein